MSIAMSVERYADTATEFITNNRILLAAKTKTPRLCTQGRGVLLASVIRPSFQQDRRFQSYLSSGTQVS